MIQSSNYLIFADEAGDHILQANYKQFPLFVLSFCIIEKDHYCDFILPEFTRLKLKYFQDVNMVFHEREIRKAIGGFEFLTNSELRNNFMDDLNQFVAKADFKIIATVIDKIKLKELYNQPDSPYYLGMGYCLERLSYFLKEQNGLKNTTITFEARGKKEDKELEFAFLKEVNKSNYDGLFKIDIQPKLANIIGLQLADLVARPIGRYVLNNVQENRAFEILKDKLWMKKSNLSGSEFMDFGLKIFP
jgi:hypothetical protein